MLEFLYYKELSVASAVFFRMSEGVVSKKLGNTWI